MVEGGRGTTVLLIVVIYNLTHTVEGEIIGIE